MHTTANSDRGFRQQVFLRATSGLRPPVQFRAQRTGCAPSELRAQRTGFAPSELRAQRTGFAPSELRAFGIHEGPHAEPFAEGEAAAHVPQIESAPRRPQKPSWRFSFSAWRS